MKAKNTKKSPIQALLATAIATIEKEHSSRRYYVIPESIFVYDVCKRALKIVKKNLHHADLELFMRSTQAFSDLIHSCGMGWTQRQEDVTCKVLGDCLYQISQIIVNYLNNINKAIMNEESTIAIEPPVIFEDDNKLSLVNKKVQMERIPLINTIGVLQELLQSFHPERYNEKPFASIQTASILDILILVSNNEEKLSCVKNILNDPLANRQLKALCETRYGKDFFLHDNFCKAIFPLFKISLRPNDMNEYKNTSIHTITVHKLFLNAPCFQDVGRQLLTARLTMEIDVGTLGKNRPVNKISFLFDNFKEALKPAWIMYMFKNRSPTIRNILKIPSKNLFYFFTMSQLPIARDSINEIKECYVKACLMDKSEDNYSRSCQFNSK